MNEIKLRNGHDRPTSPLSAIKEFCLECCGYNSAEVKTCTAPNCPLFEFRNGKNPYRKRAMTEEQRQVAKERLQKAREAKNH